MAMHIEGNWTTAHFAILYGGKRAGRSIDNRGERRSAVGAHNLRLYLEFHERNLSTKKRDWLACIVHKSIEICDQCSLWQQNSPARPENSAAFGEKSFAGSQLAVFQGANEAPLYESYGPSEQRGKTAN
jgi:hypothetical protein